MSELDPTLLATKGYVSGWFFSETTYQLYGLDVDTTLKQMKVAYIRVSSSSQSLELQREAVQKENVDKIFEEKVGKEKEWVEHHSVVTDYERNYYMRFL